MEEQCELVQRFLLDRAPGVGKLGQQLTLDLLGAASPNDADHSPELRHVAAYVDRARFHLDERTVDVASRRTSDPGVHLGERLGDRGLSQRGVALALNKELVVGHF